MQWQLQFLFLDNAGSLLMVSALTFDLSVLFMSYYSHERENVKFEGIFCVLRSFWYILVSEMPELSPSLNILWSFVEFDLLYDT